MTPTKAAKATYYSTSPRPLHTESGVVLNSGDRITLSDPQGCDAAHIETGRLCVVPAKSTESKGA